MLIKDGKTTKETAQIIGMAPSANEPSCRKQRGIWGMRPLSPSPCPLPQRGEGISLSCGKLQGSNWIDIYRDKIRRKLNLNNKKTTSSHTRSPSNNILFVSTVLPQSFNINYIPMYSIITFTAGSSGRRTGARGYRGKQTLLVESCRNRELITVWRRMLQWIQSNRVLTTWLSVKSSVYCSVFSRSR